MKLLVPLSSLVVVLVGCGARSSMETCPGGAEQCDCVAGACNPGLVCVADVCVNPSAVPAGSGGWVGTGGRVGTGGWIGSGGYVGSGGHVGSGGYVGTGGYVGSGGYQRSGGASGGSGPFGGNGGCTRIGSYVVGGGIVVVCQAAGGYVGSGGTIGAGGAIRTGGAIGTGGTIRTGGVAGSASGGSGGAGGTSAYVTFMRGRADGAMNGWAWVDFGMQATVSSPTCAGQPLMSSAGCPSSYDWATSSGLCISGSIPMVTGGDYSSNWGIMLAAECRDPAGGTLGASYSSITLSVAGTPSSGLRAVVHRHYDQDSYNYCAFFNSGTRLLFTSFNSSCWDGSGAPLTLADVPNIDWIAVMVPSSTSSSIRVSNLCWQYILLE
jgi:hypothetical protein